VLSTLWAGEETGSMLEVLERGMAKEERLRCEMAISGSVRPKARGRARRAHRQESGQVRAGPAEELQLLLNGLPAPSTVPHSGTPVATTTPAPEEAQCRPARSDTLARVAGTPARPGECPAGQFHSMA
jgi:hypothetical protein